MFRTSLGVVFVLALGAAPAAAQQSTVEFEISGSIPDSISNAAQGLSAFDVRMIVGADGPLMAVQMNFGEGMALDSPLPIDFGMLGVQAVVNTLTDSVAVGVTLPPDLSGMAGGKLGFRFDMAIPDPSDFNSPMFEAMADSALANVEDDDTEYTNTGRTAVVAGIECEEWQITASQSPADSVLMCLAEMPTAMKTLTNLFKNLIPDAENPFAELMATSEELFDGREMMGLRMETFGATAMRMEVTSISETSPGPGFFELPADLEPFDLGPLLQGMAAGAQQTET